MSWEENYREFDNNEGEGKGIGVGVAAIGRVLRTAVGEYEWDFRRGWGG